MERKTMLTSYEEENIESYKFAAVSGVIVGMTGCFTLCFILIAMM